MFPFKKERIEERVKKIKKLLHYFFIEGNSVMKGKIEGKLRKLMLLLLLYLSLSFACGSLYLVVIEHPEKERLKTEKYNKIFVAGFCSEMKEQKLNIAKETLFYLRTELKKNTHFEVIDKEPLEISEEKSGELVEDKEYWKGIASKYEGDLLIWGKVGYYTRDDSGFRKIKYRSPKTGAIITGTRYEERTRFDLALELYFHNGKNGEIVYQDRFDTSLLYRDKRQATLPIFFSLMNRVLPEFLAILIPQPSTDSRYILP